MMDTEANPRSSRTIWNPVQRDSATFLVTSAESGGTVSRFELMVSPGGGNELHVHRSYAEHFNVTEGQLGVRIGGAEHLLRPGDSAVVPAGTPHHFFNRTSHPARCIVELRPGHAGMENALRIVYGLARDRLTNRRGIPRSFWQLAVLADMGDTYVAGPMRFLNPLFRLAAGRARAMGVEAELLRRYCPAWSDADAPVTAGV